MNARLLNIIIIVIGCVLIIFPPFNAFPEEANTYIWPLSFRAGLSASFGEYRESHFHMGIDLKTYGQTGYPVRAIAAGEIFRLKVQRRGYGNALYIRHQNGYVSVYAHLERFEEEKLGIASIVKRTQRTKGYYPGNIYVSIPVVQGQVIAYTGESGAGLPHLHFELRNPNQEAVNPLINGLPYTDTKAPTMVELNLEPASAYTLIDGLPLPKTLPFRYHQGEGIYTAVQVPVVTGAVNLGLNVFDGIDAVNRCGIYSINSLCDGQVFYSCVLKAISYTENNQVGLFYDPELSGFGPTRYVYRLFRMPGFTVPVIDQTGNFFMSDTPADQPLRKKLVFEVLDSAGNKSMAATDIISDSPPAILSAMATEGTRPGETAFTILATDQDGVQTLLRDHAYINIEYSNDWGHTWQQALQSKDLQENRTGDLAHISVVVNGKMYISAPQASPPAVYRARIYDGYLHSPYVSFMNTGSGREKGQNRCITLDNSRFSITYFTDYLVFNLETSNRVTCGMPRFKLLFSDGSAEYIPGFQKEYGRYYGVYATDGSRKGPVQILCSQENSNGAQEFNLGTVNLTPVLPHETSTVVYGHYTMSFPEKSVYKPAHVYAGSHELKDSFDLPLIGEPCEFLPGGIPFRNNPTVVVDLKNITGTGKTLTERLGIYRYNKKSRKWGYVGNTVSEDKRYLSEKVSKLGVYGVMEDNRKPVIRNVWPENGKSVIGKNLVFHAPVDDVGSGIDYRHIRAFLDGKPVPMDYDPDRDKVFSLETYNLTSGEHSFRLQVKDWAGNLSSEKLTRFRVSE